MNPYFRDAPKFGKAAVAHILRQVKNEEVYFGLMLSALTIERILKGILWSVNPAFTLIDSSFKNAAPVLCQDAITKIGSKSRDEIAEKPNGDAISFRIGVLRAGLFSNTVNQHRGTLFKLGHFRDVIAHCDLAAISLDDCRLFLLGSVYPVFAGFAEEGWFKIEEIAGTDAEKLRLISIDYIVNVQDRVEKRLAHHLRIFEQKDAKVIQKAKEQSLPKTTSDQWLQSVTCPACGQVASVIFEVDFDYEDGHSVPVGAFANRLLCPFCDLRIEDHEELEEVGITLDRFDDGYEP